MTFVVDGTNGLTFPNSTTQASSGVVLQVVSATSTTAFSTASSSYVSTGFSATITPKFSTSKVLILFSSRDMSQAGNMYPNIIWYRGATSLNGPIAGNYTQAAFLESEIKNS